MIKELIKIEKELDLQIENLPVWEIPFQSILSSLLFTTEQIAFQGKIGVSSDYISRLSLIYPLVKKHAAKAKLVDTNVAMMRMIEHADDVMFLNAYAHFSMLMPQVYRGTLIVQSVKDNVIILEYPDEDTFEAELIDKLYSCISMHLVLPNRFSDTLKALTDKKVEKNETSFEAPDVILIKKIQNDFKRYFLNVKVLSPEVFKKGIGVTYDEYYSFVASLRAYSEFWLNLARSYRNQVNDSKTPETNDFLMSEYFEFSVLCLRYQSLGFFLHISDLQPKSFYKLLSYFMDSYSNETGVDLKANSFCGDGFFPPITLIEQSVIYSPHALNSLLNVNNILYSINKNDKKTFDEVISPDLEPTLINQLEYIYSQIPGLFILKNIVYSKSEIDLIVLSKAENTCLIIQVKSTIAPDSSRTVNRVQGRILEAERQIELFESISTSEKVEIINKEFNESFRDLKFINLITVRSSAGSNKAWNLNKKYRILNYSITAKIIADKVKKNDFSIANIEEEVLTYQDELKNISKWSIVNNSLQIGNYKIVYPEIDYEDEALSAYNINTVNQFNFYEESNFK
jgi:hypothetical protein